MRAQDSHFEFDAPIEEIWAILHPKVSTERKASVVAPRVIDLGDVRLEILCEGDEIGNGLVRHAFYPVPWYLGGRGESWELLSEIKPPFFARYDTVSMPPRLHCTGWHRLEDLGGGRTRIHFHEEFAVHNPLLRLLLEKPLQRFNSRVNDKGLERIIEAGLARLRAKRAAI